ncbi:MAG: hypothetical protein H6585_05210 [Flavobacteriales bacterium]|nr:hypothetical protein [Flavobacteriales bacterium]MCB9447727.1 hypothetical protein [Flavobacteriales bacterium]
MTSNLRLKDFILPLLYGAVMFWILIGLATFSGFRHFEKWSIHVLTFGCVVVLLRDRKGFGNPFRVRMPDWVRARWVEWGLVSFVLLATTVHLIKLHGWPLVEAWFQEDIVGTALVRQSIIARSGALMNYLSSFVIKAILPFSIVFMYLRKRKMMLGLVTAIGMFYALMLMQKSFMVTIFMPLLCILLLERKWLRLAGVACLSVLGIVILLLVTNPQLLGRGKARDLPVIENPFGTGLKGLAKRVLYVPGKVTGEWFDLVPAHYPYLNGCGYRFLQPLTGCEYVDYSRKLYDELFPEYKALGLTGTVNVASFVNDYANFGMRGVFLSGIVLAVLITLLTRLYHNREVYLILFNLFPVIMLSSSAVSTLLFSGGWVVINLLFMVLNPYLPVLRFDNRKRLCVG